jgi:hypothetical protein
MSQILEFIPMCIEKIFCSKIKIIFAFLSNKKSSFVDDPSSDNHVEGAKVKKAPNMRKYKWCIQQQVLTAQIG